MSDATIQTFAQVLGAGVFGFMIAKYTIIKQQSIKRIVYDKTVLSLLSLHEKDSDTIRVSVKKSVLTGNQDDLGEEVDIDNAHAHTIRFKNKGNIEINELYFDITFDEKIKIISHSISPEPSYSYNLKIDKEVGKQNSLNIYTPYLNKEQIITVSMITTGETKKPKSKVIGHGKGIEIEEFKSFSGFFLPLVSFLILFIVTMTIYESALLNETMSGYIPEYILNLIGGEIVQQTVPVAIFPLSIKIFVIGSLGLIFIYSIFRLIKKSNF